MQYDRVVDQRVATFKTHMIGIKTKKPNRLW